MENPTQVSTFTTFRDSFRLVFVYGTLMKGFGNHCYIKEGHFIGDYRVRGMLYTWHGGFPFLVKDKSLKFIKGEIYLINEKQWENCLRLEGRMYTPEQFEIKNEATLHSIFSTLEGEGFQDLIPYDEKGAIMCHYFETNPDMIDIKRTKRLQHGDWYAYKSQTNPRQNGSEVSKKWESWTTTRQMQNWEVPSYK